MDQTIVNWRRDTGLMSDFKSSELPSHFSLTKNAKRLKILQLIRLVYLQTNCRTDRNCITRVLLTPFRYFKCTRC